MVLKEGLFNGIQLLVTGNMQLNVWNKVAGNEKVNNSSRLLVTWMQLKNK